MNNTKDLLPICMIYKFIISPLINVKENIDYYNTPTEIMLDLINWNK